LHIVVLRCLQRLALTYSGHFNHCLVGLLVVYVY